MTGTTLEQQMAHVGITCTILDSGKEGTVGTLLSNGLPRYYFLIRNGDSKPPSQHVIFLGPVPERLWQEWDKLNMWQYPVRRVVQGEQLSRVDATSVSNLHLLTGEPTAYVHMLTDPSLLVTMAIGLAELDLVDCERPLAQSSATT